MPQMSARLAEQPLDAAGFGDRGRRVFVGPEDLERDWTMQTRVDGPVHLAHAAPTDEALNLVPLEGRSGRQRHGLKLPGSQAPCDVGGRPSSR